jgi:hypothetical protein
MREDFTAAVEMNSKARLSASGKARLRPGISGYHVLRCGTTQGGPLRHKTVEDELAPSRGSRHGSADSQFPVRLGRRFRCRASNVHVAPPGFRHSTTRHSASALIASLGAYIRCRFCGAPPSLWVRYQAAIANLTAQPAPRPRTQDLRPNAKQVERGSGPQERPARVGKLADSPGSPGPVGTRARRAVEPNWAPVPYWLCS